MSLKLNLTIVIVKYRRERERETDRDRHTQRSIEEVSKKFHVRDYISLE